MKVLLVGNYPYLYSQSMDQFATILDKEIKAHGHESWLLRPKTKVGRVMRKPVGVGKWLGYLDMFILFPVDLKPAVKWADVIHICDHANALYVPWLRGKPHVVTCHDMIAVRSARREIPKNKVKLTGRVYERWILNSLKKAQHIACVSATTESDLLRLCGTAAPVTSVVHNGLNYSYTPMPRGEQLMYFEKLHINRDSKFFLHVGSNSFYKNRAAVIRIFSHLVRDATYANHRLVMAGKGLPRDLLQEASRCGVGPKLIEVRNPTQEQLRALYSSAEALIYPSLYEGFCWPIIEAQACGCPVFTSNRHPMMEVGGEGAAYLDPQDYEAAATVILHGLRNRDRMVELGYCNAEKYSTSRMVDGYLKLYKQLIQRDQ